MQVQSLQERLDEQADAATKREVENYFKPLWETHWIIQEFSGKADPYEQLKSLEAAYLQALTKWRRGEHTKNFLVKVEELNSFQAETGH